MSKLRVSAFTISIDGYGAGPSQSLDAPMGEGAEGLHEWFVNTPTFKKTHGDYVAGPADDTGVDEDFARRSMAGLGAWIMGRNMFGPVRGEWPDASWQGWWGPNPPYHVPVYVLTHHARAPITMAGGTTFHFVTDGIHAALERAREAAQGRDIRLGGGAATVREYLAAGLVDELHLAISPVLLGRGEHLLGGIDMVRLGYKCSERAVGRALHVVLSK
ncbi:MAG: dihydrofolate reductase family protein [Polyangiaceae bacterium]|nr:dihydrofolate reductase family protein [Polyangiaceae bacterium]